MDYGDGDIREVNGVVNEIGEETAEQPKGPEKHGTIMLRELGEILNHHR